VFRHVFVGIGSNLGDPRKNCSAGVDAILGDTRVGLSARSSLYITSPVSPIDQPDFVNCAVRFSWEGDPLSLLALLRGIEEQMGRTREVHWGPRTLDLDVLLMDDLVLDGEALTVPHPGLHVRRFALVPCLEIDPDLVHPRFKQPLRAFLDSIGDEQKISLCGSRPC